MTAGKQMMFGRYLSCLAVATAIGAAVIAFTVDIIDPFGLSPITISIPHVNTIKIARNTVDRLVKPYDAVRMRPRTIIVGTSRTKQAFNPALIRADLAPAYNAGMDGLKMAEAKQLLEFYFRENLPIEHIWLEVFPLQFGFHQWGPVVPVAGSNKLADMVNATFSMTAVQASIATVRASMSGNDVAVQPDGWRPVWSGGHIGTWFVSPQFAAMIKTSFGAAPLNLSAFDDLDAIVAMCVAHGVDLKLFVGPIHPVQGFLYWATAKHDLQEWLRRIAKHHVVMFVTADIFREYELDRPKPYYMDSSHFSVPAAEIIMRDLASFPQMQQGKVLTEDNAAAQLQEWQEQLRAWAILNPQYGELVAERARQISPWASTGR